MQLKRALVFNRVNSRAQFFMRGQHTKQDGELKYIFIPSHYMQVRTQFISEVTINHTTHKFLKMAKFRPWL